jgi:hypothetical protein
MATYATVEDVQARMMRTLSTEERNVCESLLEDAGAIIDSFASTASSANKKVVSCRMVMRALGDGADSGVPMGATQGSQSALGYSQSWTISNGASGELYLSKLEKQLLGVGNKIGSYSPLQELVLEVTTE